MSYLRLLATQIRISLVLGMQYRWEFLVSGGLTVIWTVIGIVPLYVAFANRPDIGGWNYDRALIVVGWFTMLKGVLDGAVNPSLISVVDQIRKGTLDFTLLKPADAQFLVSTAKFDLLKAVDVIAACVIFVVAFTRLGRLPAIEDVAVSLGLLGLAIVVLYSVWILVVSLAFWVVRLDNLTYLFNSLFDFARWPVTIFKGFWQVLFTVIIPLGLMTTYPAQALLGDLSFGTGMMACLGGFLIAVFARTIWKQAIGKYTSASS